MKLNQELVLTFSALRLVGIEIHCDLKIIC
jgi:hypothetical protein